MTQKPSSESARSGPGAAASGPDFGARRPLPAGSEARQRGVKRRAALRMTFAAALGALVLVLALPLAIMGQEITAPSWIAARLERQADRMLGGGSLSFGEIKVALGDDLHPRIALTDMVLSDASGQGIAQVPRAEILVSPRGLLLSRELLVQEVRLTGAALSLARDEAGRVALAFGGGGAKLGAAPNLGALFDRLDRALAREPLAALESILAEDLRIDFADARAGRAWTIRGERLALELGLGATRLDATLSVPGVEGRPTRLDLAVARSGPGKGAEVAFDLTNVDAADLATQSPALAWLAPLEADLSARLRASLDPEGALGPVSVALQIGAGAVRPDPGAAGIEFEAARAHLSFDPAADRIRFEEIAVATDWGSFRAEGQTYLREIAAGWPGGLVSELRVSQIALDPPGAFGSPLRLGRADITMRLRLEPFRLEIASLSVADAREGDVIRASVGGGAETPARLHVAGDVAATPQGWQVALDVRLDAIEARRVMEIWPVGWRPGTRGWFDRNLLGGRLRNLDLGVRIAPGAPPRIGLSQEFDAATVRFLRQMPPIEGAAGRMSWDGSRYVLALDRGRIVPEAGGPLEIGGSVLVIPDTRVPRPPTEIRLAATGSVTAALAVLDRPPLELLTKAGRGTDLATGAVEVTGQINLPLGGRLPPGALSYDVTAELSEVESEQIVPGRRLAADALQLQARRAGIEVSGQARLDGVPIAGTWSRPLGPDASGSIVEGRIEISPETLAALSIGPPRGTLSGRGSGELTVVLAEGAAPEFTLASDLRGIGLSIPAIGWFKPAGAAGRLDLSGRLGAVPEVPRLALAAPGLEAEGGLTLGAGGRFERLRLDRVAVGGWLSGAVDILGRGPGAPPGIRMRGGSIDLRRAAFGSGGSGHGPLEIALDRLTVTEGIALTGFRGDFEAGRGLSGRFTGQMNGGTEVAGTVAPVQGRVGVRLRSQAAGEVIRDAGLVANATGGTLDLTLLPTGAEGDFDGRLSISGLRVRDAPALASLLDAVSVVGLLQQLDGQGLAFDEVAAEFRLSPDVLAVTRASASGPGLGISLDGRYWPASREMDFQGVISPFYILNRIGSVLTRPGEGLFGFNYTLRGSVGAPQVSVNPLSALTPGMFREIFRAPPPEPGE